MEYCVYFFDRNLQVEVEVAMHKQAFAHTSQSCNQ